MSTPYTPNNPSEEPSIDVNVGCGCGCLLWLVIGFLVALLLVATGKVVV